jgi:hypothetical protein
MDIKNIFNIILLALSLTTIFITLISYIVFKLRQASSMNSVSDFYKLEGSYFRRYAPELEKLNEEKREEILAKEKNPKKFYIKILSMFAFVFLVIFSVFLVDEYYHSRSLRNIDIPPIQTPYDEVAP